MEVSLVMRAGKPFSIGVGPYCFELKDGLPEHNKDQMTGAEVVGKVNLYYKAYGLACLAAELDCFDSVENN